MATQQNAVLLGQIDGRLISIEKIVVRLDQTINGNGKPGIIADTIQLQQLVKKHCEQDDEDRLARELLAKEVDDAKKLLAKETQDAKIKLAVEVKEKKDKWSGRTWAIVLAIIVAFVSNSMALIFLYIRMGTIR
jgi:hypothetical protein